MCKSVLLACPVCVPGAEGQKTTSDPKTELTVLSCHIHAGSSTLVLCKSSKTLNLVDLCLQPHSLNFLSIYKALLYIPT